MKESQSVFARPRRHGFVLVMTLFIVAIASLLLANLATHSFTVATNASNARRDFQKKWAIASCQQMALAQGRYVFKPKGEQRTPSQSVAVAQLSGITIQMVLADESAKIDVNSLAEHLSDVQTKSIIRDVVKNALPIQLRPNSRRRNATENAFESWGQVFEIPDVTNSVAELARCTRGLTCWGRQININTASRDVIFNAVKPVAGAVLAAKIAKRVEDSPELPLAAIIGDLNVPAKQMAGLRSLLAERSKAQSVWIHASDGASSTTTLTIRRHFTTNIDRIYSFSW